MKAIYIILGISIIFTFLGIFAIAEGDVILNNVQNTTINISVLEECEIVEYVEFVPIIERCNGSQACVTGHENVTKNRSVCHKIGYKVNYADRLIYNITGECCGYFNDTKQIVCKEKLNGICNPKCQQTSRDPEVYDEFCMIYTLTRTGMERKMVGDYDYVRNNQVTLTTVNERIKRT